MYTEKLPSGKIRYVERYTDYITGKTKKISITLDKDTPRNRGFAKDYLADKIKDLDNAPLKGNMRLSDLVELYEQYQLENVKLSTATRNKHACSSLMRIIGPDALINRLTADYVRNKFIESGDANSTLNERLKRFKALMRWAYQEGYIDNTICIDRLKPFKDTPYKAKIQDKYLEAADLKILVDNMDVKIWHDLTEFLSLSGLRFGEAASLLKSDIDLEQRYIHVDKTLDSVNMVVTTPKTFDSIRDVYIQDELLPLVKELYYNSDSILLFANPDGSYIHYYAFNKYFRENCEVLFDRRLTVHSLRHTHCSLCAESGMQLEAISRRLGHSDSKITKEVYLHITSKQREKDNAQMDKVKIL